MSYFDVGASYGIQDEEFPPEHRNEPPLIFQVGIRNPLGVGIGCKMNETNPALIASWRQSATAVVGRRGVQLGWTPDLRSSEGDFKDELTKLIENHPITCCELTIFGVGTALLWLEFAAGIEVKYLRGMYACFELAAYTETISGGIRGIAHNRVCQTVINKENQLASLSKRPEPQIEKDAENYLEIKLLTAFTGLHLCVDKGDDKLLSDILRTMQMDKKSRIDFDYNGSLYFGWAHCVLLAKDLSGEPDYSRLQIERMIESIKIAHTFLGTCESLEKLLLSEISSQVSNSVAENGKLRDARELNRLRTLALTIVSLTDFRMVTASDEDQKYFALFEQHAYVESRNKANQNRCDILFSIQLAETEAEQTEKDRRLGYLLAFIAGLTLVSVLADSYNFYKGEEKDLISTFWRGFTLCALFLTVLILFTVAPRRFHRRKFRKKMLPR